ncbi:MAG: V-type ATPase subunit [Deltaproteobacteria bacterium]|nr:V-type ATPase subunit [Deltaproteobacteria bacterium]
MIATTLGARARGLATRLCGEELLAEVERATDAATLTAALVRAGYLPAGPATAAAPAQIERAGQRRAADDLAVLARWTGDHADALAVIMLDEDRRALRAIARGLAAGAPSDRRIDGAIPTTSLPRAALEALAGLASTTEIAALLTRREHPLAIAFAPPPRTTATGAAPAGAAIDLLAIELALASAYATRARAARGAGIALATHVAQVIDAENATAALLLAARGDDLAPARAFVPGGARLDRATFLTAARGDQERASAALATAFARTPIARAVTLDPPAALDDAALAWHLATQARLRIAEPHGLAPVLHLVLRRRAEARRVRRAAWRVALAAPVDVRAGGRP